MSYAFPSGGSGGAKRLLVSATSPDDKLPPVSAEIELPNGAAGALETPIALVPGRRYSVAVSALGEQGVSSQALTRTIAPQGHS